MKSPKKKVWKRGVKCGLRTVNPGVIRPYGEEPRLLARDRLPTWKDVGLALDKETGEGATPCLDGTKRRKMQNRSSKTCVNLYSLL